MRSRDRHDPRHDRGSGTPHELLQQTGRDTLEEAFVRIIGSEEGLN